MTSSSTDVGVLCPRDGELIVRQDAEGHEGFACSKCQGMWLPITLVHDIQNIRHFTTTAFIAELQEATTAPTELYCPARCGHLRAAVKFGVELDWCPSCKGVWFDNGELKALLAHFAKLEKSDDGKLIIGYSAFEAVLYGLLTFFH